MYIRKTIVGGLFSIAFIFGAAAIMFSLTLRYAIDNIEEKKALVPLIALQEEYEAVIHI